jgi:hypothetical protein
MRIRVWNAFASNNSGSYTLVGSFPSPERAAALANLLAPIFAAQTDWIEAGGGGCSPLERLAIAEHLEWEVDADDWPQFSTTNTPEIAALGPQLLLHHGYTVTLPRFIGHLVYVRGGKIDTILDHAHHPVVSTFEVYWPWDAATQARAPELERALVAALRAAGGPLDVEMLGGAAPVVGRTGEPLGALIVAATFADLVAGVSGVHRTIERHEGRSRLRISEAFQSRDPLAEIRRALAGG